MEEKRELEKEPGAASRDAVIVRTSLIGIGANILLAAFKAAVGLLSHSIAVVLDAVNNLTDALSSVITIIGTRLAGRKPDKEHPFGHGRVEYLTASVIAVIVLYAGVTSLVESVKKIITPDVPDYSPVTLVVIVAAVVVKVLLGRYVKSVGEKVNSDSLVNSGEDATLDSIISASTLVAAVIFLLFHVQLEAWLGAVISLIIIKSGVEMLSGAISQVVGERADSELTKEIKQTIASVEGVRGAYDLFVHDYGPDRVMASVHVEVPDSCTAAEIDVLTRKIQHLVYEKHHVIVTAVGIYSHNTQDDEAARIRERIQDYIGDKEYILQMHGFYCDLEKKLIRFDLVVDFAAPDRNAIFQSVKQKVMEAYPDYTVEMFLDTDVSD